MGVGITLHQPARFEDRDAEVVVLGSGWAGEVEPGVAVADFARVAQRAAAKPFQAAQHIERQEPAYCAGLNATSAIDQAVDRLEQAGLAFEPQAEARGQRAHDFLHPRMPEFGGVDELIGLCPNLAAHAFETTSASPERRS